MKRHFNCKLSIAKEQELLAYYNSGHSLSEVGAFFGLSLTGVQKIMKHYNNPRRSITDSQTGVYYNNKDSFFSSLTPKGDCLLWQGAMASGYGTTTFKGKRVAAHRLAYILTYGPITKRLHVLHKCDTPRCCNPNHLFLGTHKDNMEDRATKRRSKGGQNKGEKNPKSKLTETDILAIRSAYLHGQKQKDIGQLFGIHHVTVSAIVNKKLWRHI